MTFLSGIFKAEAPPPDEAEKMVVRLTDKPLLSDDELLALGLEWLRLLPGAPIPPNAVQGGWTWRSFLSNAQAPLFVGRIDLGKGHVIPGKVSENGEFHYAYDGREVKAVYNYDVLVLKRGLVECEWMPCSGALADERSVVSGGSSNGAPLFVARSEHNNGVHIGFVERGADTMVLSWGGGEVRLSSYDVLVLAKPTFSDPPPPYESTEGELASKELPRRPTDASSVDSRPLPSPESSAEGVHREDGVSEEPNEDINETDADELSSKPLPPPRDTELDADVAAAILNDVEGLERELTDLTTEDPKPPMASSADDTILTGIPRRDTSASASVSSTNLPAFPAAPDAESAVSALFPPTQQPERRTDPSQLYSNPKVAEAVRKARERSEAGAALADSSTFAQLGRNVAERGERLSELALKTEAMESSAKGFLDTIKELNKQQQSKGWFG